MSEYLIYEKEILIRSEQVDMTRRLRTSELFRILEEASIAHTEQLGFPRETTLDRGLLWVITRQTVEIDELPAYDDLITVKSWQEKMMHVFFPRHYEIWKGGKRIIKGEALWVLIDEKTREIAMPEDFGINIPGLSDADDIVIPAIRMPEINNETSSAAKSSGAAGPNNCAFIPFIEKRLETRFSQVDINGHMNNTRYFDIIDDALYSDLCCITKPRKISANYLTELRAGDAFTLKGYKQKGSARPGTAGPADDKPDSTGALAPITGTMFFEGSDTEKGTVYFRVSTEF